MLILLCGLVKIHDIWKQNLLFFRAMSVEVLNAVAKVIGYFVQLMMAAVYIQKQVIYFSSILACVAMMEF